MCAVDSLFTFFVPDTNMMEARDPTDPSKTMFKVLQISLACPACMEAGRASECTHMEKFRPPWKVSFLFVFPTLSDSSDTLTI